MPLNWLFGSERSIDEEIERWMEKRKVPGLAACIVKGDQIVWSKGYGQADMTRRIPFTPDRTLFQIASISKTLTATAIMQLRDRGRLQLDDDINDYLPLRVRNPEYPNRPITFRHLLNHTSSIDDSDELYGLYAAGDPSLTIEEVVRGYFTPGGRFWDEDNFEEDAPGEEENYSNAGYALLGYLVEAISGQPLEDYLRENIYKPLRMTETSFYICNLDQDRQARCYTYAKKPKRKLYPGDGDGNLLPAGVSPQAGFNEHALYSYPTLADGMVRTSVNQLANFLIAMINGGRFEGHELISEASVREMLSGREQGLCWCRTEADFWGHDGSDPGCATEMEFDPRRKTGLIIFANTEVELDRIKELLRQKAEDGASLTS